MGPRVDQGNLIPGAFLSLTKGPGDEVVDQASNTLNSNVIFHSHLVLISIAIMLTKDGALFIKCNCTFLLI